MSKRTIKIKYEDTLTMSEMLLFGEFERKVIENKKRENEVAKQPKISKTDAPYGFCPACGADMVTPEFCTRAECNGETKNPK